jgi:hypothetical protein
MRKHLLKIIDWNEPNVLPKPLTFADTANRDFEEKWWNDIKLMSRDPFRYKGNGDIATDEATRSRVDRPHRDLERLGDYFIARHRHAIAEAGLEGIALCGEMPFKWDTDFDYGLYGGWVGNKTTPTMKEYFGDHPWKEPRPGRGARRSL